MIFWLLRAPICTINGFKIVVTSKFDDTMLILAIRIIIFTKNYENLKFIKNGVNAPIFW
jgi:hypothetical protein